MRRRNQSRRHGERGTGRGNLLANHDRCRGAGGRGCRGDDRARSPRGRTRAVRTSGAARAEHRAKGKRSGGRTSSFVAGDADGIRGAGAGGEPVILGNAADRIEDLGEKIERGLKEDALVLSGGVSMGKYDLVESVLKAMGAEFLFDAVAIRPGKPAVFGMCQGKPVFGLPGNPVSTMVTFELFVAPAIDLLGGAQARALPLVE